MFVFNRSALAVLVPLAMLAGVAAWSNRDSTAAPQQSAQGAAAERNQTVAANLPSR
jgi:uncharacterized lipoprotein YajG